MGIINIPAYSYFTNDPASYRTDICVWESSGLIEKMRTDHPEIIDSVGEGPTVYSYSGTALKMAWKTVNSFFGTDIIPYIAVPYMAVYNSNFTPQTDQTTFDKIDTIGNILGCRLAYFQVDDAVPLGGQVQTLNTYPLNSSSLGSIYMGKIIQNSAPSFYNSYGTGSFNISISNINSNTPNVVIGFTVYPDGVFDTEGLAPRQEDAVGLMVNIYATFDFQVGHDFGVTSLRVAMTSKASAYNYGSLSHVFADFDVKGSGMTEIQTDDLDPYQDDGTSGTGGGDGGGGGGWIDSIDNPGIPALPTINICDLGLITMYNPTEAQVKALSSFLWSGAFDLNTYKKLFTDPMDGIIGLAIVPVAPSLGGSQNVKIGNVDSGVSMSFLSSNWVSVDCGWLNIEKFVGCFMDGDPYTKIQIYLPFIGIRPLSADDINGGSIHVVYHVDVLTGACAAFIEHNVRGVLYTYNGSCITNVPLTAINFSGAIQNAVSAVVSGIGMVAGAATGAAPITAMGAAGLLQSAANTAINSKPNIQRSGNLGGSAGILSILTPYVIIERPKISMPANMNKLIGNTSNITFTLSTLTGFTMVEYIHIEGCTGTSEEIAEIESLLKQGVYL